LTVLALSRGALTAGAWPLAWQAGVKTQGTSSRCRRQIAWYVAVGTIRLYAISIRRRRASRQSANWPAPCATGQAICHLCTGSSRTTPPRLLGAKRPRDALRKMAFRSKLIEPLAFIGSRNWQNHPRLLNAASAPATEPWPSPPARRGTSAFYVHGKLTWFCSARRPGFTPPLTPSSSSPARCSMAVQSLRTPGSRRLTAGHGTPHLFLSRFMLPSRCITTNAPFTAANNAGSFFPSPIPSGCGSSGTCAAMRRSGLFAASQAATGATFITAVIRPASSSSKHKMVCSGATLAPGGSYPSLRRAESPPARRAGSLGIFREGL
jgi:hypothetical protein